MKVEQYPSVVYFESESFTDEGNGIWDEIAFYDVGDLNMHAMKSLVSMIAMLTKPYVKEMAGFRE